MLEAAGGRPAVAFQHAGVALAEDRRRVLVAATWGDPVDRDLRADEGPQPRSCATDPPAGLVGRDHGTGPHARGQRLVGGLRTAGGPSHRLDDPTGGDLDAELAQQRRDLAGRHAQPLAEPGRQRHRPGTKLGSRRAERVGGLRGWRGCTRRPHTQQRPIRTSKRVTSGRAGGSSSWYCTATRSSASAPPQPGQHAGNPT